MGRTKKMNQVNEVFDCDPIGYTKWACFGCWCEPFAACLLAKKLKISNPWLYAAVGLMCWVGWLLVEISLWFYRYDTHEDLHAPAAHPTENPRDENWDPHHEKWHEQGWFLIFLAGELVLLVFGIWALILWYRLRRTFMHHAGIKEDESSSCCYITTWKVFSFGQMGSHAAKANWVLSPTVVSVPILIINFH